MPSLDERTEVDLRGCVEGDGGIRVIRSGGNCRSWNNIQYKAGMSAKNVGSTKLSMNVATDWENSGGSAPSCSRLMASPCAVVTFFPLRARSSLTS